MARVLVIEDDTSVSRALNRLLTAAGHTALSAATAKEGLDQIDAGPVDLVISDISMPGHSGIANIVALRKRHPELPLIVISGSKLFSDPIHTLVEGLGVHEFLEKPFDSDALLNAVKKVLS
jgi:DNA-binding NtrC family response regulator